MGVQGIGEWAHYISGGYKRWGMIVTAIIRVEMARVAAPTVKPREAKGGRQGMEIGGKNRDGEEKR